MCEYPTRKEHPVATNLALDDKLINEAVRVSGHRTKKAAVTHALTEYIERHKQRAIVDLFGKLDLMPVAEMKRQRNAARGTKRQSNKS
jgi:ribosomal protein S12 methylthiotransferase accessory factor YcaO